MGSVISLLALVVAIRLVYVPFFPFSVGDQGVKRTKLKCFPLDLAQKNNGKNNIIIIK